jgi:hypothetical protein
VNVRTGNCVYFDTTTHRIGPRHVMASGELHHDAVRTLRHPQVLARPRNDEGVVIFDLAQDGRE